MIALSQEKLLKDLRDRLDNSIDIYGGQLNEFSELEAFVKKVSRESGESTKSSAFSFKKHKLI